MPLQPRPEIENVKTGYHGGIKYAELRAMGISPEAVLDFSVCTNPFMPPPQLKEMLNTTPIERYPDSEATEFRQRLSEKLGVSSDNILVGSGTTELIRLVALAYFRQGDSVLILEPTYGEYEVACQITGAEPVRQWGREEDNFAPKIAETVNLVKQYQPRAIFICNPNNPNGKYFAKQDIEAVLAAGRNTLLILDEAYISFVNDRWASIDLISQSNLIILRSMTKDYSLAGLRLGYAIADKAIINNLHRVCPPWNVNIIAQQAGIICLESEAYLEQSKAKIKESKKFLVDELRRLGFPILPSDANFFLMKAGGAQKFRSALLKYGILVRDCTSFGLPEYIRLASRTMPECQKLIATIRELIKKNELDASK